MQSIKSAAFWGWLVHTLNESNLSSSRAPASSAHIFLPQPERNIPLSVRDPGYIESVLCLQVSAHISMQKALRANFQVLAFLLPCLFYESSNHYPSKFSCFQISIPFLDKAQLMVALSSEGSFETIPPQPAAPVLPVLSCNPTQPCRPACLRLGTWAAKNFCQIFTFLVSICCAVLAQASNIELSLWSCHLNRPHWICPLI